MRDVEDYFENRQLLPLTTRGASILEHNTGGLASVFASQGQQGSLFESGKYERWAEDTRENPKALYNQLSRSLDKLGSNRENRLGDSDWWDPEV